ncbi:MAG: HTH domain-containing protein [Phycisphaerae bacterium]|nr:HTH domain-containing protein [Phycisphaerae bacterium]
MKKKDVQVGNTYAAKIGSQLVPVRLDAESRFGGWDATNLRTKRRVRIKSAAKLRYAWRAITAADRPPQDIDERIAAAPPSIVPYEQRRARAEAAAKATASEDVGDEPTYDPDRCATQRCRGTPVMTHLGRPLCQVCWERHCVDDAAAQFIEEMDHELNPAAEVPDRADATVAAAESIETASAPVQTNEETDMATKTAKKTTNARKASAKRTATSATTKSTTTKSSNAATPSKTGKVAKAAGTSKADGAAKAQSAAKTAGAQKPKRTSALDAAAQVLAKAGKPMHAQELITAMAEQGLWSSPGGKTPHATLYAAMMREERDKGRESRFRKVDRGQFAYAG